jgi:hypothetical protein
VRVCVFVYVFVREREGEIDSTMCDILYRYSIDRMNINHCKIQSASYLAIVTTIPNIATTSPKLSTYILHTCTNAYMQPLAVDL